MSEKASTEVLRMDEKELMDWTKEKAGEAVKDKMSEILKDTVDPYIKDQVKEQFAETVKKFELSPIQKEVAQKAKGNGGFNSFGEQLSAIYMARKFQRLDERLIYLDSNGKPSQPNLKSKGFEIPDEIKKEAKEGTKDITGVAMKTMTAGVDSAGGFLVFDQVMTELLQLALENEVIQPNGAMVVPMTSDSILYPRIDETSHSSSLFGGVVAYYTEEAGTKTASEPKWGQVRLTARELSGYTVASDQLLADSAIALEPLLKRLFGEAWGWFKDYHYIQGTGVGQPLGILNSPCLISLTRQANNAGRFNDLVNIWNRVLPRSREKGYWFMNHEYYAEMFKMGAGNATQASGMNMIWIARDQGAALVPPKQIFGRPILVTEKMSALGSAGDVGFFDPSYYIIGERSPLTIDVSKHVYFLTNKTAWRFTYRHDGQPWLYSALTPKNGTNTLSPFVTLSDTS